MNSFFNLRNPPPPRSTLFPYTTLFRSEKQVRISGFVTFLPGGGGPPPTAITNAVGALTPTPANPGPLQFDARGAVRVGDRKSTRLNSSHRCISYAVFCLKKKNRNIYSV